MFAVTFYLRFRPTTPTYESVKESFYELFKNMANTDNITLQKEKPFNITASQNSRRVVPCSAYTFNNATSYEIPVLDDQLIGIVFSTVEPVLVYSVQIIQQYVHDVTKTYAIGIYDRTTTELLGSATLDPQVCGVDSNGFYTVPLTEAISFNPDSQLVIVSQLFALDQYLESKQNANSVQIVFPLHIVSGAETLGTSTLAFPTTFPDSPSLFVGLEFQYMATISQTVFRSGLENGGYATSPPKYINGFIVSIPNDGKSILIQPGITSSQYDNYSITMSIPTRILFQTGVNGLDEGKFLKKNWYNVFVIASENPTLYPTAGLLSFGRVRPSVLPAGYTYFRRIGSVYLISDTQFIGMQQENLGRFRRTFLTGSKIGRIFVNQGRTTPNYVPAPLIYAPPTATSVTIGVRGTMLQNDPLDVQTPINAIVRFRPRFQTTEDNVVTLGIPNAENTYGEVQMLLSTNPIPLEIEYRLFPMPGTGGSVPNSDDPKHIFTIDCFVVRYSEILF